MFLYYCCDKSISQIFKIKVLHSCVPSYIYGVLRTICLLNVLTLEIIVPFRKQKKSIPNMQCSGNKLDFYEIISNFLQIPFYLLNCIYYR